MLPSLIEYFWLFSMMEAQIEERSNARSPISLGSSNGTGSNIRTGRMIFSNSFFCLELSIKFSVARTPKVMTVISPMTASSTKKPPMGTATEYFLRLFFLLAVLCFGVSFGEVLSCTGCDAGDFSSVGKTSSCSSFAGLVSVGAVSELASCSFSATGCSDSFTLDCRGSVGSSFCHPATFFFPFFVDISQPHFILPLPAGVLAKALFSAW